MISDYKTGLWVGFWVIISGIMLASIVSILYVLFKVTQEHWH